MRDKVKRNFVCVKIIKIKNIPKKEREATKAEVDLLRRLHHPNIVRYLDSFISRNGESLCICMEYCDGVRNISSVANDYSFNTINNIQIICHSYFRVTCLLKSKRQDEIYSQKVKFYIGLFKYL